MFDYSAMAASLGRSGRSGLASAVALVLGAVLLGGSSTAIAQSSGNVEAPGRVEEPFRESEGDLFDLNRQDPLGLGMMMARVRGLEKSAEMIRRREMRKAAAARKRALAKKRAAAKRRAAKKAAEEKALVAAAKRAAKRKRAAAKRKEAAEAASSSSGTGRGGLVVGDSVALGAESCLVRRGFSVDAVQSRSFDAGFAALRQKPRASLPANVVIHLGTNGPFSADKFHAVMSHIGADRNVTWVTIALPDRDPYGFESSLNQMIKDLASSYNNTSVADWNGVSQGRSHWFYDDQIHINSQGCEGFGEVVDSAG